MYKTSNYSVGNPPSDVGIINYYISNNGNISNPGTSSSAPTTVAGISGLTLTTRSRLNFNRGETYEIALTINNNNIYIDAYGVGTDPIFIGSQDISGLTWTNEGDGTYSTPMVTEPNMIYIGGIRAKLAETPWITVTSYPATNQLGINNADVVAYGTITGSRLNLKSRPWTTEYMYRVNTYVSSVITINQATAIQTSIVGTTFKLLGKKAYMTSEFDWAWESNKLYIKSTINPISLDIRQSISNIGITISALKHHIDIKNISFRDYYYSAIKRDNADKVSITYCTVQNSSGYGIACVNSPMTGVIEHNTIFNCDGGIYDVATYNMNINYNIVYNIAVGGNVGTTVDYSLIQSPNKAIFCRDLSSQSLNHINGEVSYNTVYNCASTGIQIQSRFNCHHNIVHDFMMQFSDGSGIYSVASSGFTTSNAEIHHNLIYNDGGITFCAGIYIDNRSISFNIHDNVIYNITDAGINVNWDTQFTTMTNNIIVDCESCIRYRQGGTFTAYQYTEGNISTGNIFALRSASQYCHKAEVLDATVNYNPFTNGSSNNNYYISPYITRIGNHTDDPSMTFLELQTRYTSDAASTVRVNYKTYVNQAQAEIDVKLLTNETATPVVVQLGTGYIDINGNVITQATVPAYGGYLALKS